MRYFISDLHMEHKNILKYCSRPFSNLDVMHTTIVDRWNSVVNPSDICFHIGDFSFGNSQQFWLSKLNGIKINIQGNHDLSAHEMENWGFDVALESATIKLKGWGKVLLSHYPIEPDSALQQICEEVGLVGMIHGHQHNQTPLFVNRQRVNVSCENINYTPISEVELVQKWSEYLKTGK